MRVGGNPFQEEDCFGGYAHVKIDSRLRNVWNDVSVGGELWSKLKFPSVFICMYHNDFKVLGTIRFLLSLLLQLPKQPMNVETMLSGLIFYVSEHPCSGAVMKLRNIIISSNISTIPPARLNSFAL